MKTNEIRITIKSPPEEVFEFTVEPKNTSKWVETINEESCDTKQIDIGTKYTNDLGTLIVTDYDRNIFFELTNKETQYQYSYSYRKIDDDTTELTYFECMLDGSDLEKPMDEKNFEKLKELLEK